MEAHVVMMTSLEYGTRPESVHTGPESDVDALARGERIAQEYANETNWSFQVVPVHWYPTGLDDTGLGPKGAPIRPKRKPGDPPPGFEDTNRVRGGKA
jgi:hypothetical protein